MRTGAATVRRVRAKRTRQDDDNISAQLSLHPDAAQSHPARATRRENFSRHVRRSRRILRNPHGNAYKESLGHRTPMRQRVIAITHGLARRWAVCGLAVGRRQPFGPSNPASSAHKSDSAASPIPRTATRGHEPTSAPPTRTLVPDCVVLPVCRTATLAVVSTPPSAIANAPVPANWDTQGPLFWGARSVTLSNTGWPRCSVADVDVDGVVARRAARPGRLVVGVLECAGAVGRADA